MATWWAGHGRVCEKNNGQKNVQTRIRTDNCVFMVFQVYIYMIYVWFIYLWLCMYTINTVLDPFVGQTWCFTLTASLAFAKKHRSIKSVLRKMLQRSIKSVLEVTWEKRYNVAKSVLEVTHPNPPHPWHSITSMRKCQGTLLPTPPHPTPSHHKLAPRQSASAKEPYYPPHPTTAHPTKNRAES